MRSRVGRNIANRGNQKHAGNSSEVASQEAHDTGAEEWVAVPRDPGCILSTMEQVPWEGLGQGLNAIHSTLPDDHTDFRYRVEGGSPVKTMMSE